MIMCDNTYSQGICWFSEHQGDSSPDSALSLLISFVQTEQSDIPTPM